VSVALKKKSVGGNDYLLNVSNSPEVGSTTASYKDSGTEKNGSYGNDVTERLNAYA